MKRFIVKIIINPIDSLSPNIRDVVRSYLEKQFINTNFSGSYILEIDSINRISHSIVSNQRLDGSCYVSVDFNAKILTFVPKDIYTGEVIKMKDNMCIIKGKNVVSLMKDNPNKQIQQSDKIIFKVCEVKHSPQQGYISIISDPFVPTTSAFDNIIYKTTNNKDIESKFVMEKYEELTLLISELGDIKKVSELLYPYSNVEYEKKNTIDLKSLVNNPTNCLLQINSKIPSGLLEVYKFSTKETKVKCIENNIITIEESYNKIILIIIEYFIQHFKNIKVLLDIIDDPLYTKSIEFYKLNKL